MSDPNLPAITLDRAQREAIRDDIRATAGALGDISLKLEEAHLDRAYIVRKIAQLERVVAALDAIGWAEPDNAPDQQTVTVDADLASWAGEMIVEMEIALHDLEPRADRARLDKDLDSLSGLRMIADA